MLHEVTGAGITSEPILLSMTEAFGFEYRLLTGARKDAGINVRVDFHDDGLEMGFEFTSSGGQAMAGSGAVHRLGNPWDQALYRCRGAFGVM